MQYFCETLGVNNFIFIDVLNINKHKHEELTYQTSYQVILLLIDNKYQEAFLQKTVDLTNFFRFKRSGVKILFMI